MPDCAVFKGSVQVLREHSNDVQVIEKIQPLCWNEDD
eukprot:CAMPEP_0117579924 /NCGR_PEP_ID=MMETSP0784-20121206/64902_1 /TAXON_ID=39447 /ORGANISM="" /LENGTH=36 /DNA_ID= /DNA_START= /DNA_END= /DNA_ORIENTATION=